MQTLVLMGMLVRRDAEQGFASKTGHEALVIRNASGPELFPGI